MSWIEDTLLGTDKSKDAASLAASTTAEGIAAGAEQAAVGEQQGAQMEVNEIQKAINLLSQREQLPMELRDEALGALSGYYQTPGELQPMGPRGELQPMGPLREMQPMGPRGEMQGPMSQQQLIDQAMSSPLYRSILGSRKAGEESILRNRSATGGLRSGGSQKDLYDYNLELENKALLDSYYAAQGRDYANLERQDWNLGRQDTAMYRELDRQDLDLSRYDSAMYSELGRQDWDLSRQDMAQYSELDRQDLERLRRLQGMEGFASYRGNEDMIAAYTADIGSVKGGAAKTSAMLRGLGVTGSAEEMGEGILGRAEIGAQSRQSLIDTAMGGAAIYYSDIRLKDDIRYLGTARGFNFYGWTWNEEAKKLGLEGECSGLMAHEVNEVFPNAISEKDGYLQIAYNKIGEVIH